MHLQAGDTRVHFIDTPGAYPGIDAEERSQSEAIGRNIFEMAQLEVPIITTIIGEGGSGGALAISVADSVLMLQYAVYSVISPEGCASILWKTSEKAEEAAEALGITAHRFAGQLLDPVAGRAQRPFSLGRRTAGIAQGLIRRSHALACGLMGEAGLGGGGR